MCRVVVFLAAMGRHGDGPVRGVGAREAEHHCKQEHPANKLVTAACRQQGGGGRAGRAGRRRARWRRCSPKKISKKSVLWSNRRLGDGGSHVEDVLSGTLNDS